LHRTLGQIRALGMKAGVVIDPASPPELIEYVLHLCDIILVMTVNPGFGGQSYLRSATTKIARVRAMMNDIGINATLQVDGGITAATIAEAHGAGADTFVVGTAVFGEPDIAEAVRGLKRACLTRV